MYMDPVEDAIIQSLYGQHRALMIKEIAQICGLERHTITRRLDRMEILGRVRKLEIGNSKRYYLSNTLPIVNLVDVCSDLIIVINEQWKIQYINKSAQVLFNLLDRPMIGERVDQLNLKLFSSAPVIEGLKKFDPQNISQIELPQEIQGTERWYEISIMNISFKPGITSIVLIAADITENKKIKQRLLESEERFRSLFEFAPIAINEEDWSQAKIYLDDIKRSGVTDLNEHLKQYPDLLKECICRIQIQKTNKLSRLYYQRTQDTPISVENDIFPYLTEESLDATRNMIISIYENITIQKFEISVETSTGEIKYFLVHQEVIQTDVYDMSRVFTAFQDITESKNLHKELIEKQEIMLDILEGLINENYDLKEKLHFFH